MSFYKANDVNIIFSDLLILNDDTIRDIKHKIVKEITETLKRNKQNLLLSVEEVYMFALKEKYLDMIQQLHGIKIGIELPNKIVIFI